MTKTKQITTKTNYDENKTNYDENKTNYDENKALLLGESIGSDGLDSALSTWRDQIALGKEATDRCLPLMLALLQVCETKQNFSEVFTKKLGGNSDI